MNKNLLGLLLFLYPFIGYSQSQFNRAFGRLNEYDEFFSLCQTPDSGYAFFGDTYNPTSMLTDLLLVKTDANGKVLWSKSYSYSVSVFPGTIACNQVGDLFLSGNTYDNAPPYDDIFLMKTNAIGDTAWTARFSGPDSEDATDMIIDTAGNPVICGSTYSFGSADQSGFVIKTDLTGGLIWSKSYEQNDNQYFNGIINTKDGGYLLSGSTERPPTGSFNSEGYLVKTDGNGDVSWSKRYGGSMKEVFYHAMQEPSGNIYIAGSAGTNVPSANQDGWLVKLTEDGTTTLLNYTYGSPSVDRLYNVLNYPGSVYNSIVLTGNLGNAVGFENNVYLRVSKTTGAVAGGLALLAGSASGNSRAFSSINSIDSGFVEAGFIYYPGNTAGDAYAVKYPRSSNPCQLDLVNVTVTNQLLNLNYVDSSGTNAYPAAPTVSSIDLVANAITIDTVTFCSVTSTVKEINNPSVDFEIAPNPVTSSLNIHCRKFNNESISLKIMDMSGRILMQSLITKSDLSIPVSNLKPGVYQLAIGNDQPAIKKFVKVE